MVKLVISVSASAVVTGSVVGCGVFSRKENCGCGVRERRICRHVQGAKDAVAQEERPDQDPGKDPVVDQAVGQSFPLGGYGVAGVFDGLDETPGVDPGLVVVYFYHP